MVIEVPEEIMDTLDCVEDKQHPEGIQDDKKDDDRDIHRLAGENPLARRGDLKIGINHLKHIDEPEQKDDDQDYLKEREIKVTHEPLGGEIVQIAHL